MSHFGIFSGRLVLIGLSGLLVGFAMITFAVMF
jgi:hypothetical protein